MLVIFFLMIRLPPRSTRTDTLFPYTTLCRSPAARSACAIQFFVHGAPFQRTDWMYGLAGALPSARTVSVLPPPTSIRSEEHTSELQSLMRISYAVFCLKKKKTIPKNKSHRNITITHAHQISNTSITYNT